MFAGAWAWIGTLKDGHASFLGTVTGSGLGLVALLIGALFNAHLSRKRDAALRRTEARAVAAVLMAELSGIRDTLREHAEDMNDVRVGNPKYTDGFVVTDLSHAVLALPHILPKIGLLEAGVVSKVMAAYWVIDQYLERLILLGGVLRDDMPNNRRAVHMPGKQSTNVAQVNSNRMTTIHEAVVALDGFLRVSR
jgi:hypothetical protein